MSTKTVHLILLIIIVLPATILADGTYSGGTGEPNDPYLIAIAEDMQQIGSHPNDWDAHFLLVNDINLADYTGEQFNIIGCESTPFTGVFDGNGHTINNFSYTSTGVNYIGLFRYVINIGKIKNLGLVNANVDAGTGDYVGCLVGHNIGGISNCYANTAVDGNTSIGGLVGWNDGTISNCHVKGTIDANQCAGGLIGKNYSKISNCYVEHTIITAERNEVGGLIGLNWEGEILNCYAHADVSGDSYVGGLAGDNTGSTISQSYAFANVSGNHGIGGLVGYNYYSIILKSFANGNITGNQNIGGLAGICYNGSISDCYATGSVSGLKFHTGGLVASNSGTISNCYSSAIVDGNDETGGLVGYNSSGVYTSCFWNSEINPDINGIGNTSDPNVTDKTTAEMKTVSTFLDAGWDLVAVWNIEEGQVYPLLRKYSAVDTNYDGKVDFADFADFADHWLTRN